MRIFNRIVQTAEWPRQWTKEHITVIPKSKTDPPQTEDDLRNIAKTTWMSKLCEALLGDFLLPVVDPYIDPGQCGGFRGTSVTHYLIKLCDFIQKTLDKTTPPFLPARISQKHITVDPICWLLKIYMICILQSGY